MVSPQIHPNTGRCLVPLQSLPFFLVAELVNITPLPLIQNHWLVMVNDGLIINHTNDNHST